MKASKVRQDVLEEDAEKVREGGREGGRGGGKERWISLFYSRSVGEGREGGREE